MTGFTYSPLNQDVPEFRVLEISSLGSNTSEDSPLLCTLTHEPLPTEAGANYKTVSYCWGDDKTLCMEILVNGKTLLVPKSADRTLRNIRSLSLARTVWIDAVCINQSDDIERGLQVALMNRIYRYSSGNLIDLGDDGDFAQRAYDNINAIAEEIKQQSNDFRTLRDLIMPGGRWAYATQNMKCVVDVDALTHFYSRPWFRRVWVIQEAFLAPYSGCICGTLTFDFQLALVVAAWLKYYHGYHIPFSLNLLPGLHLASSLWDIIHPPRPQKLALAWSLELASKLDASDARDRVYGMLGVNTQRDADIHPLLIPDYRKPAYEVFRDATMCSLLTYKRLYILKLISHHTTEEIESSVYPSWVPRLDRLRTMRNPSLLGGQGFQHADSEYWHEDWNPANGCLGIAQGDDANVLTLCGLVLDDIASTTPIVAQADNTSFWLYVIETTAQSPNVYEPRFSRALTADMNYRDIRMTQDDADCFQDFMAYLLSNLTAPPPMSSLPWDAGVQVRRAAQWWQAMNTACNDRCWAMTKTHDLMALVPKISQVGDIIVSIPAAHTPYVLRPLADGYYYLLGECYLENHMDGEAFQKQQRQGTPSVVFKIR